MCRSVKSASQSVNEYLSRNAATPKHLVVGVYMTNISYRMREKIILTTLMQGTIISAIFSLGYFILVEIVR